MGLRRLGRAALAAALLPAARGGAAAAAAAAATAPAPASTTSTWRKMMQQNRQRFGLTPTHHHLRQLRASSTTRGGTRAASEAAAPATAVVVAHARRGLASSADGGGDADGSARRALEIAVDRTGLYRAMQEHRDAPGATERPLKGVVGHLASIIRFRGGPVSVAAYMQEVLTHPEFGYYMHRDVFGSRGDFTTSPEISQAGRLTLFTLIFSLTSA